MPLLDVSEVLSDPLVAGETFTVLRRQETVTNGGVVSVEVTQFITYGSVTPTGSQSLVREEAYATKSATIKVITNFMLRGQSKDTANNSFQPDIVLWNNTHYLVVSVDDFSHYGVGMVEAECSSIDWRDYAPATLLPSLDFTDPANSQGEPQI